MSQSAAIKDVSEATFADDVIVPSRQQAVVVDFWAPWCGPCHQLSPLLERSAARHAGDVTVVKVNVDEAPALAARYGVQGIPAVKAFRDGEVVAEFVGAQPEAAVTRFFAGLVPSEADRLSQRAGGTDDPAERERLLRDAVTREPDHPQATVMLAELLADRGDIDEALGLLDRVPQDAGAQRLRARLSLAGNGLDEAALSRLRRAAADGDAVAALQVGRSLAVRGEYEESLTALLRAVVDTDQRDEARQAVLDVFTLLGEDHDLVRRYRPKLASALF